MTRLQSFNPATGELVGDVPVTPASDIPGVVARARAAQPAWQALGSQGRAELLIKLGESISARADELGELLTREMGKPLREAIGEITSCGMHLREHLDEIAEAIAPEEIADGRGSNRRSTAIPTV